MAMKEKLSVQRLVLILIVLTASGCGGHAAPGVESDIQSLPHGEFRAGSFACTSFAVYGGHTFYGMNFDYPDVELRFTIRPSGDRKVFQMEFAQGDGFSVTVGMNSAGLFSSCQMLYPEAPATTSRGPNDLYPWQVYEEAVLNMESVSEVAEFIGDKTVVHWSVTLHDLFADAYGDAMVVEVGRTENVITRIEDDFLVMTNFPNGEFAGQSYTEVEGVGADRYKIAYENISDNLDTFDVDVGLETLEKAALEGEFSTQASMVFDPDERQVYLALRRDFSKIWKVSIADGTIETFSGFGRTRTMPLDASGIFASELESFGSSPNVLGIVCLIGLVVVLIVAGAGAGVLVLRRRSQGAIRE
jgi:hypothetical protein